MGEYFYSKILIKYSSMAPLHGDISIELIVSLAHPRKVVLSCPRASRICHFECVKADFRDALQCPHWQIVRRAEDLAANDCSNCIIVDSISVNSASKQKEMCRWLCSSIPVDFFSEERRD